MHAENQVSSGLESVYRDRRREEENEKISFYANTTIGCTCTLNDTMILGRRWWVDSMEGNKHYSLKWL